MQDTAKSCGICNAIRPFGRTAQLPLFVYFPAHRLNVAPHFLGLQPPLDRAFGGARWSPALGDAAGLFDQARQSFARYVSVAGLVPGLIAKN